MYKPTGGGAGVSRVSGPGSVWANAGRLGPVGQVGHAGLDRVRRGSPYRCGEDGSSLMICKQASCTSSWKIVALSSSE